MTRIYVLITLFLMLLLQGCSEDLLEIQSENQVTYKTFWADEQDAVDATTTIYQPLQSPFLYSIGHIIVGDVWGDDLVCQDDSWAADIDGMHPRSSGVTIDGQPDATPGLWRACYAIVYRANFLLENIDNIPATSINDSTLIIRSINEARFLRGVAYFNLATSFGDVPLLTENKGFDELKTIGTTSKEKVWDQVELDLRFAAGEDGSEPLPEKGVYEFGRATKAAAQGFLARTYLYRNKMEQAAAIAKKIIDNPKYALEPDFGENWNNHTEHGMESVFEVTFATLNDFASKTYGSGIGNWIHWLMLPGTYHATGRSWTIFIPSEHMDSIYEINQSTGKEDLRAKMSVYRDGDTIYQYPLNSNYYTFNRSSISTGLGISKYNARIDPENPRPNSFQNNDLNNPIIRLAEIYLIYAEAIFENNVNDAWLYLNKIRERAGLEDHPDTGSPDYETFLNALMKERRIELFAEGHRFFDLRRWGKLEEIMTPYGYDGIDYLPIPEYDASLNPNLLK